MSATKANQKVVYGGSKPNKTIRLDLVRNLVFQGGSVKGLSYVGALAALEKCYTLSNKPFHQNIKNVAGTSAGAITAVGLAMGYTIPELVDIMANTDFKEFLNEPKSKIKSNFPQLDPPWKVQKEKLFNMENESKASQSQVVAAIVYELNSKFGLCSGEPVLDWLEGLIRDKTDEPYLTFGELHDLATKAGAKATKKSNGNESCYRDLFVVGFNLSTMSTQVFSYEDTPDAIISDAVRISMSIPILFLPHYHYIKSSAGERVKKNEDLWIDGGLTDNFPVRIFDRNEFNVGTLGFYLVSSEEKALFEEGHERHGPTCPTRRDIKTGIDYLKALFEAVVSAQQASTHLQSRDPERTIYIDNMNISALNFGLSMEEKQSLVNSGWSAVMSRMGKSDLPCEVTVPTPEGSNLETSASSTNDASSKNDEEKDGDINAAKNSCVVV